VASGYVGYGLGLTCLLPLTQDAHLSVGNGAQLIGKVNPDLSIKVLSSLNLQQSVPVGKSRAYEEPGLPF